MNKLNNPDVRREACWLWNDLIMEAQFADTNSARGRSLQDTLDKAADLIEALFNFSEDEHYYSVVTRKYRSPE